MEIIYLFFFFQKNDGNFVPMDFSGSSGRVINDPLEVAMVEMEHQRSWKQRLKHRISNAGKMKIFSLCFCSCAELFEVVSLRVLRVAMR